MNNKYLKLLSKDFPTIEDVSSEIINLSAICQLPKGTEYFFSDIHGEAAAFSYLISTASGTIRRKIEAIFSSSLPEIERIRLGELIYRPEQVLENKAKENCEEWCYYTILRLVDLCKDVASKYTRSKVRKKMPTRFSYIMDEMLHANKEENKETYYISIIQSIVETGIWQEFIIELCYLIRKCSVDQLHIVGDIFDRGPHADVVIDELMSYNDVDIQWGNHDIQWMGAAAGSSVCIAGAVRIAISYNNFDLLEDSYGINLRGLSIFAAEVYKNDSCKKFMPRVWDDNIYNTIDFSLAAKMHKAISIIQFKLEGQLMESHPEFGMSSSVHLKDVDYDKKEITIDGTVYKLCDDYFPTIDPSSPLELSEQEQEVVSSLIRSFTHSPKLKKHVSYLYNNGSLYKICNDNLLYHGCIPMDENGDFTKTNVLGETLSGKAYFDRLDQIIRDAYFEKKDLHKKERSMALLWYACYGKDSPVFGKDKITTFQRYFVLDADTHKEEYNPYYKHIESRDTCKLILEEFSLYSDDSYIVNGHVPVRASEGDNPIKGHGLLYVIDGGIAKSYHAKTGLGGYTLISNSHHVALAKHKPFIAVDPKSLYEEPNIQVIKQFPQRVKVADTDIGKKLKKDIGVLYELLEAYHNGTIRQQNSNRV